MESVLVDFYNLELDLADFIEKNWETGWRVPKEERPKILEFFEKHAPKVLKYTTAEQIKALPKPIDVIEYSGTLGAYEESHKMSWFDSGDAEKFYWDYHRIRKIVDGYFKGEIPKGHLQIWEKDFSKGFRPSLWVGKREDKEAFTLVNFPDDAIDLTKYTFLRGQRIAGRWGLATANVVSGLYEELFGLLEGKFELRRCEADDCGKIFVPTPRGRNQRFCSKTCYHRIRKRIERAKK